jgi:hypothetical protein
LSAILQPFQKTRRKPKVTILLGKPMPTQKDEIKQTDIKKEDARKAAGLIWLRTETNARLL